MVSLLETAVRIDQCLYGYNDGHRLLAASRNLPEDAASLLLVNSDAVAGTSLDEYGYWTGLPLPQAQAYALMRTWPAPEMPRPGCVWTHALIVATADIARFADMRELSRFAVRPRNPLSTSEYGGPILAEGCPSHTSTMPVSDTDALQLLRALYSTSPRKILSVRGRQRENALFAVWSQQWPRLRRSFSFQTAGLAVGVASFPFSLRLIDDPRSLPDDTSAAEQWERSALDDLREPGEFRRFIWRYGSDIRNGQERFSFLAKLFGLSRQRVLGGSALFQTLHEVVRVLPIQTTARC